ncbi:MAG: Trk system potassium transporter TrkA [Bacillota bacterium]|nr:Trk system potassium transporter TrkA [Bacillota bacterium]
MHIIILGGGGVGSTLATLLSNENQDVVIIEKDPDLARRLNEEIDGLVKCGNGASAVMLEEAGIKNAEMLIAVTEVDEVNMIACMLAKKYNVPITVARVRNPEYYHEGSSILSNEQLGIDIIINPERVASFEIAKIIRTPNVRETEYFAKGQIKMVSIFIDEHTKLINQPLFELPIPKNSIVAAIERKSGVFIVPGGNDIILPGDKVFLLGKRGVLDDISWLFQKKESRNLNVLILGGGRIGFQLAELLEFNRKNNINVKIIEKDADCCQNVAAKLNKTLILQGDATDLTFLKQEDIQNTDVLVAVTGDNFSFRSSFLPG